MAHEFLSRPGVRAFAKDRRAGVAIVFAFALIPLVLSVGIAVDHSRALAARDRLTALADAAAIEAVTKSSLQSRRSLPDSGKSATEAFFRSQAGSIPDVTLTDLNVNIVQTFTRRDVTASGNRPKKSRSGFTGLPGGS